MSVVSTDCIQGHTLGECVGHGKSPQDFQNWLKVSSKNACSRTSEFGHLTSHVLDEYIFFIVSYHIFLTFIFLTFLN